MNFCLYQVLSFLYKIHDAVRIRVLPKSIFILFEKDVLKLATIIRYVLYLIWRLYYFRFQQNLYQNAKFMEQLVTVSLPEIGSCSIYITIPEHLHSIPCTYLGSYSILHQLMRWFIYCILFSIFIFFLNTFCEIVGWI